MANVLATTFVSPLRWVFSLTGDGTVAGPVTANSVILTTIPAGPLRDVFNATYADQAAMRAAILGGAAGVRVTVMLANSGADVTAEHNQPNVDVDVDAITATKPELNFNLSDTTGMIVYVTIEWIRPENR